MQARVRFHREPLTQSLWDEALPLLFAHWKEVAHYQDIELTPDIETYTRLEANGVIRVFTARAPRYDVPPDDRSGLLVGYALFIVTPHLHYRQVVQAQNDVIYIQPDQRGTMPLRFIDFCTESLFADGVDLVCHHPKVAHNFGPILERQGFSPMDVLYVKRRPVNATRFPRIETNAEARS